MGKNDADTLYVLAATYDDVDAAVRDYDAVKELYRAVRSSHDFDAAVIATGIHTGVVGDTTEARLTPPASVELDAWDEVVEVSVRTRE